MVTVKLTGMRIIKVFDNSGRDVGVRHKGTDDTDLLLRAQTSITSITGYSNTLKNGTVLFQTTATILPWTYTISAC